MTSAPSMRIRATFRAWRCGVDLTHVDGAVEAEERAGGGGGDAVLAGAGLGDDAGLAHALGEQGLAEHVVDLVGAGVVQVLALEEDPGAPGVLGEAGDLGQRAGPAGVVDQEVVELAGELRVGLGLVVLDGDLVHGGDERLGNELAAEGAEVALGAGDLTLGVRDEERTGHASTSQGTSPGFDLDTGSVTERRGRGAVKTAPPRTRP